MKNEGCIDAGREVCPCALAEAGRCLICGRLSGSSADSGARPGGKLERSSGAGSSADSGARPGESCDDCCWQGVCVYTLKEQNGRRMVEIRKAQRVRIVERKQYSEDFEVLVFEADMGFCQKAKLPAAYIFARPAGTVNWYDMPVSVLKSEPDKGFIHIAVKKCGPKSTALLSGPTELEVKGIYYNGLSSLRGLAENKTAVVYGRGPALAPLRNFLDSTRYSSYLRNLHIYIDASKTGLDFIKDYFGDLPVAELQVQDFSEPDFEAAVKQAAAAFDADPSGAATFDADPSGAAVGKTGTVNLFALASPYYVDVIQKAWRIKAVRPNNSNMCCGEGVCGACSFDDEEGRTVHRCKALLD